MGKRSLPQALKGVHLLRKGVRGGRGRKEKLRKKSVEVSQLNYINYGKFSVSTTLQTTREKSNGEEAD